MTANTAVQETKLAKGDKFKNKTNEQVKQKFIDWGYQGVGALQWNSKNQCKGSCCVLHGLTMTQYEELVTQGL